MKCVFCHEKEATCTIPNPNDFGSIDDWNVCKGCKKFISKRVRKDFKKWLKEKYPTKLKKKGDKK